MTLIKLKRAYDNPEKTDGYRIFVDRLWPRGLKKEEFKYDLWAKNITPSEKLREWFHEDIDGHWEKFKELYKKELANSEFTNEFLHEVEKHDVVTLVFAAKDIQHTHAIILKEFIEQNIK